MSNRAHARPKARMRTVVTPQRKTVKVAGTLLPAIPRPKVVYAGLAFRCGTCDALRASPYGYRKHYVLAHIYKEQLAQ